MSIFNFGTSKKTPIAKAAVPGNVPSSGATPGATPGGMTAEGIESELANVKAQQTQLESQVESVQTEEEGEALMRKGVELMLLQGYLKKAAAALNAGNPVPPRPDFASMSDDDLNKMAHQDAPGADGDGDGDDSDDSPMSKAASGKGASRAAAAFDDIDPDSMDDEDPYPDGDDDEEDEDSDPDDEDEDSSDEGDEDAYGDEDDSDDSDDEDSDDESDEDGAPESDEDDEMPGLDRAVEKAVDATAMVEFLGKSVQYQNEKALPYLMQAVGEIGAELQRQNEERAQFLSKSLTQSTLNQADMAIIGAMLDEKIAAAIAPQSQSIAKAVSWLDNLGARPAGHPFVGGEPIAKSVAPGANVPGAGAAGNALLPTDLTSALPGVGVPGVGVPTATGPAALRAGTHGGLIQKGIEGAGGLAGAPVHAPGAIDGPKRHDLTRDELCKGLSALKGRALDDNKVTNDQFYAALGGVQPFAQIPDHLFDAAKIGLGG